MDEKRTHNLDETDRELKDEMVPRDGEPVPQERAGGDVEDSAGQHGDMKPELARALGDDRKRIEK